jgi:hypothetical protein
MQKMKHKRKKSKDSAIRYSEYFNQPFLQPHILVNHSFPGHDSQNRYLFQF